MFIYPKSTEKLMYFINSWACTNINNSHMHACDGTKQSYTEPL